MNRGARRAAGDSAPVSRTQLPARPPLAPATLVLFLLLVACNSGGLAQPVEDGGVLDAGASDIPAVTCSNEVTLTTPSGSRSWRSAHCAGLGVIRNLTEGTDSVSVMEDVASTVDIARIVVSADRAVGNLVPGAYTATSGMDLAGVEIGTTPELNYHLSPGSVLLELVSVEFPQGDALNGAAHGTLRLTGWVQPDLGETLDAFLRF